MNRLLAVVVAVLVAVFLGRMMLFQVDQRQSAIVFSLGEIRRVIQEPGLYWKWPPPVQTVRYFDNRTQTLDDPDIVRFITSEKMNIQVDYFVKWRISDPRLYFISVGGNFRTAEDRISRQLRSELNNKIALLTVDEVISGKRDALVVDVRNAVSSEVARIGIEIVDVRLNDERFQAGYPQRGRKREERGEGRVAEGARLLPVLSR